ncbi:hypothetical protein DPMN_122673 [Dreissena polymorpha]|uniref:Uncharacterized protein n=1 Tax=Dreissena polymorpha TaxID=45954 RepID=A0A9D4JUE7_DREPO|nr:hypothetical protein DPMN_122673 [Dreissena polymorpha]
MGQDIQEMCLVFRNLISLDLACPSLLKIPSLVKIPSSVQILRLVKMISLVGVQCWILLFQKLQVVQRREDFQRAYHLLGRRQNHLILWSGDETRE